MRDLFHFDIETVGNYEDYDSFSMNDKKGAELFRKKFTKMKWDSEYSDINEAYINNAGILSTYGKIVCISSGYISNGEPVIASVYGDDERDIVYKFNNLLNKIEEKNFNLCGYRILYFDIPWILHKCHKYNIEPSNIIKTYDKKPWEMRVVDISEDWKGKFAWSYSFDEVAYEIGVESPKDNMDGSDVHKKYWQGDLMSVKKYCEKDIKCSIDISKILYA